ncbi:MAG: hypothetical protein KID09_21170 [Paenibacillus macerans]|uniref:hypothetical protein n=1 Tax=Paenibacillus macerans TaxID=44252 RepID=UPI00242C3925|nr:hypothetical protein [Paenibacillus macerans]MBS5913100.1 hypothetical protein [Paenibacillus macerans]
MIRFVKNMMEADKLNALAEKRNGQAFEKLAAAEMKIAGQYSKTLMALEKLSNRKKGILRTSIYDFIEVYEKIMRIDFVESDGIKQLDLKTVVPANFKANGLDLYLENKELSTEQILSAFIIKGGVSGVIAKEAELNARLASIRNSTADVVLSQADTICVALEGIETRAHKISDLLAKLNILFRKTTDTTSAIISEKGISRLNYTKLDKEKLMTCINAASTIKKILDTPLIDTKGRITEESIEAIRVGNDHLAQLSMNIGENNK